MRKQTLALTLLLLLMLVEFVPSASAHPPNSTDPEHLVIDTILEPETLDPAWANDVGSFEVIMNVYETLLFFNRSYTLGPYATGKVDQFVPKLATSWTEQAIYEKSPQGLMWVSRWTFTIRTGVKFHDGSFLTPEDVEYSFERLLVQDRTGGPSWMLFEPLFGQYGATSPGADENYGFKIDQAIESNATAVWFNLLKCYPSTAFMQIFSQPWSSVMKKDWAVAGGDFDGDWNRDWSEIFETWHDPSISFLEGYGMMGTGPYRFEHWEHGVAWSVIRNDAYWDGWPAWKDEARTERIVGYISRVTWYYKVEWVDRRSRLWVGDSDLTYVVRKFRDQVLGVDGIRCYFYWPPPPDEEKRYLILGLDAFFFNFNIDPTSPNLGWGFNSAEPYKIDFDRIPVNLFSDINVRLGFAYGFDYDHWFSSLHLSEGELPADPIIKGVPYDNPNQQGYSSDLDLAAYYLELAWGGVDHNPPGSKDPDLVDPGDLWNNGMAFTIVYPNGNVVLEEAASMLAYSINSLHLEKFHVSVQQADWGSTFLPQMSNGQLPLFLMDYQGGFRDPHSFVQPFMQKLGVFAHAQRYNNATVNDLIKQAIITSDGPERQQIYYDLQAIYHNDVPSVPLVQPAGRLFERDWMRGWYFNPLYQGQYFYHRWKAKTHFGDADNDGAVGVLDMAYISGHWTKPSPTSPVGPLGYNPAADLSGGVGGTTGSEYGQVPGISDGKVNVVDSSLVSSYWDRP